LFFLRDQILRGQSEQAKIYLPLVGLWVRGESGSLICGEGRTVGQAAGESLVSSGCWSDIVVVWDACDSLVEIGCRGVIIVTVILPVGNRAAQAKVDYVRQ